MRTITFEVEVDDKIFDTMVPSIDDDAVKNAPDGRLFLCVSRTSVAKKLVRISRDATAEGGKEAPWFDYCYLPDEMRVVGMSGGNAAEYVSAKSKLVEQMVYLDDERASRIEDILADILQRQFDNQQELLKKHEELLDHFKQIHEQENWLQEHQTLAEDRLMNHIQECCDKAMLTTNTCSDDIIRALPELEDRIKEYIGKPDTAQPSTAGNAPSGDSSNQVLLRALDILESAIKK